MGAKKVVLAVVKKYNNLRHNAWEYLRIPIIDPAATVLEAVLECGDTVKEKVNEAKQFYKDYKPVDHDGWTIVDETPKAKKKQRIGF